MCTLYLDLQRYWVPTHLFECLAASFWHCWDHEYPCTNPWSPEFPLVSNNKASCWWSQSTFTSATTALLQAKDVEALHLEFVGKNNLNSVLCYIAYRTVQPMGLELTSAQLSYLSMWGEGLYDNLYLTCVFCSSATCVLGHVVLSNSATCVCSCDSQLCLSGFL